MLNDIVQEILALGDNGPLDALDISGAGPVIPTRYRVSEAGTASMAASGLAAAEVYRLRTGIAQSVAIDVRRATAGLRSYRYPTLNGDHIKTEMDRLSGFYPVKDGRSVFLHCNFPHLRASAASTLKVPEDADAFRKAALTWEGEALETALFTGGGCGAFVRSHEEWALHPQYRSATASAPVLEIRRIDDAPPRPLPSAARPLAGVRVLDLTRVIAGPTCARTLAEHGADVLKITRADLPSSGDLELDTDHGKLSTHLDLRQESDFQTLTELIRTADIFSQSYRPGSLARRGLSPQDVAQLSPGIIYVSLSAWRPGGPWADFRGYDTVVQSATGMAYQGRATPPRLLPVSAIDYVSGYILAYGAMVALARRSKEGGSWMVRTSLEEVGRWIVELGMYPPSEIENLNPEFSESELADWVAVTETPKGRLTHLSPIVQLSNTPAFWERPPVPLGFHRPTWPGVP